MHEIAPVFLKNFARIEALFTVYFLALLVQAVIEREVRQAMKREKIELLPLYPEQRRCHRPSIEQALRLFAHTERHTLLAARLTPPPPRFPPKEIQKNVPVDVRNVSLVVKGACIQVESPRLAKSAGVVGKVAGQCECQRKLTDSICF